MPTLALNPKLTTAGFAAMPNGTGTGFAITLTHIAIGTALYAPTGAEVALRQEVARFPITSGTNPTPSSIQTGTTITDTDPNGRSPNNLAIGEIGWFAGNTLVAVWSRVTTPLFVKSPQFDVPFAYTLDISAFPDGSVTVTVTTDPQGMASLINQHEAKVEPHPQYVRKERGMGEYDVKTVYTIGAKVTGPDGKTYRSIVNNNIHNTPGVDPTKWERWGHSVAELDAEFVPRRTGSQVAGLTQVGMVRITNPDAAYYSVNNPSVVGAFKITLPTASVWSMFKMRVEIFDATTAKPVSLVICGSVSSAFVWSGAAALILGETADRDFNVRFGNDGALPCVWIGELNSTWNYPRVYVPEIMVTNNADGGTVARWNSGWAIALVTVFGAVSLVSSGNLVFGQSDVAHVGGLQAALDAKLDKSGGDLTGQLRVAEGSVGAPGLSFINDGAPDTGLWHISDGVFGVSTNSIEVVRFGGGVASFVRRPSFGGATPWDTANFNPANYLALSGGNINGTLGIMNSNSLMFGASNGYTATMRADATGMVGLINGAQNAWNLQINDSGFVNFPRARPGWAGLTPWDNGNFTPATKQNAGNYMRGGDGADGRYVIGWNGNLQMYVDGAYVGQMWTSVNFNPATKVTLSARNNTNSTYFISGSPPNIAAITSSNNSDNVALTISTGGNLGASAVIQFHREGSYAAYFGLDTDNQWAVGGRSMGNVRYRLWHEGNFNPSNYAPIRNGNSASGGYVVSDTNNKVTIQWGTGGLLDCYADSSYQGGILTHINFANWVAPRSVMDYGGIGSYTYMNTGANPGANTLVNLPGLGGTWRCMSGGFGTQGKDYLYVRIG